MPAHRVVSMAMVNYVRLRLGGMANEFFVISAQWAPRVMFVLLGASLAAPPARFTPPHKKKNTLARCSDASGPDRRVDNLFVQTSSAKIRSLECKPLDSCCVVISDYYAGASGSQRRRSRKLIHLF